MSVYGRQSIPEPINEAYFGKTKELQRAEELLGQWRSKYSGLSNRYFTRAAADPLKQLFQQQMAECFGFSEFLLILDNKNYTTVRTIPSAVNIVGQMGKVKKTSTGYKFDGTVDCLVFDSTYSVFGNILNDGELLSVYLHEIGHNFSPHVSAFVNTKNLLLMASVYLSLIGIFLNRHRLKDTATTFKLIIGATAIGRKLYSALDKALSTSELLAAIVSLGGAIASIKSNISNTIEGILTPFMFTTIITKCLPEHVLHLITSPVELLIFAPAYVDERIADQFPVMYGYGPEFSSAMYKIEHTDSGSSYKEVINEIPIANWIYDLYMIPINWLYGLFDEHQTGASRRANEINYLEAELRKNGLSATRRKDIINDLNEINAQITDLQDNVRKVKGSAVFDAYQSLAYKLKHGDDPREILANADKDVKRMDSMSTKTKSWFESIEPI